MDIKRVYCDNYKSFVSSYQAITFKKELHIIFGVRFTSILVVSILKDEAFVFEFIRVDFVHIFFGFSFVPIQRR